MDIIPAIDIIEGKCVRLTQGDYGRKKIYNERPLEVAMQFEDIGLRRLHLVDLDGARSGQVKNWKVLEQIAAKTKLIVDFGGGVHQEKDLEIIFNSGAAMATVGSLAVKNEPVFSSWIPEYGADRFLLGADVKDKMIAVSGWQETTTVSVFGFLEKYAALGIRQVFCTDISKDGLLEGPSIPLYREIMAQIPGLYFIASGGVSSMEDLENLREAGCSAAILGKAIYEGRIALADLVKF